MKPLFRKKAIDANKEAELFQSFDTGQLVDAAYKKREKEIESLRKYDRGEKDIIAPDIRNLVRSL